MLAIDAGAAREFVTRREHGVLVRDCARLVDACVAAIREPRAHEQQVRAAAEHPLRDAWSWDDAARVLLAQLPQTSPS